MYISPVWRLICWKIIFLRLYKAAVKLQINGPIQRLLLNLLVPTELYEFFRMPKQRSIMLLLDLKALKRNG